MSPQNAWMEKERYKNGCINDLEVFYGQLKGLGTRELLRKKAEYETKLLENECNNSPQVQMCSITAFALLFNALTFFFGLAMNSDFLRELSSYIFIATAAGLVVWVLITDSAYNKINNKKYENGYKLYAVNRLIEERKLNNKL